MDPSRHSPFWILPLGRVDARWWILAVVALVLLDYVVGPTAPLPVLYVVPVILGAWYSGLTTGLWLALLLPATHLAFESWIWPIPAELVQENLFAGLIRISTFTLIALLTFRLSEHERALARDLAVLEGMLPLCSFCKSIKNGNNEWEALETYLRSRSGAEFTHDVCPDCTEHRAEKRLASAASSSRAERQQPRQTRSRQARSN